MLLLVVISLTCSFAADENATDLAMDDEIEESLFEDIEMNETETSASQIVTPENFNQYFDTGGNLTGDGDELTLKGEFNSSDIGVERIVIERPVVLKGDGAVLSNIAVEVKSNDVVISNLSINAADMDHAISVADSGSVEISDSDITFQSPSDANGFAVIADNVDNLRLINNSIRYVGNVNGATLNKGISISRTKNAQIKANRFNIDLMAVQGEYADVESMISISEGIEIYACFNVEFSNNTMNITNTRFIGQDYTFTPMAVLKCNHTQLNGNDISIRGIAPSSGIIFDGGNFTANDNIICFESTADSAALITGSLLENALIFNNNLTVLSPGSSYAIQTEASNSSVIYNNTVLARGTSAMAISSAFKSEVFKNDITVIGEDSVGIDSVGGGIIEENHIVVFSDQTQFTSVSSAIMLYDDGLLNERYTICRNNITTDNTGIYIANNVIVEMYENCIDVVGDEDSSTYAIIATYVSGIVVKNNNITQNVRGNAFSGVVYLDSADNAVVTGNRFNLTGPDYFSFIVYAGGSKNLYLAENDMEFSWCGDLLNRQSYLIYIYGQSDNAIVRKNTINAVGGSYLTALALDAENITVDDNSITLNSDNGTVCGINPLMASGSIRNNDLTLKSKSLAYAVNSAMYDYYESPDLQYVNNTINAESFFACGFELGGVNESITGNRISLKANYTMGIGVYSTYSCTIEDNIITLDASNVGDSSQISDNLGSVSAAIRICEGNVSIINNTVNSNSNGIIINATHADVARNTIIIDSDEPIIVHAIEANYADDLKITDNTITFTSKNAKSSEHAVISAHNVGNLLISHNSINATMPSGTGSVIEINRNNRSSIMNNQILHDLSQDGLNLPTYAVYVGAYSGDVILKSNSIEARAGNYTFAISCSGGNLTIDNNSIKVSAKYSYGIALDFYAHGIIENNNIAAEAENAAYAIHSGLWLSSNSIVADYVNNTISATAFFSCGIKLAGYKENAISNRIDVDGNYSVGIGLDSPNNNLTSIMSNEIKSMGSCIGNQSDSYDNLGHETTGIKVLAGNMKISQNDIRTTGEYAIVLGQNAAGSVSANKLQSKSYSSTKAIRIGNIDISDNGPEIKTILVAGDFTKSYGSSAQYEVCLMDENGNYVSNRKITLKINGNVLTQGTDANGVARFAIFLNVKAYSVEVGFAGDDVYFSKSITKRIVITKANPMISASKKTFKAKAKTKKYTVTLNANKRPIAKAKLTLKIKGKTFRATTNAKGKATFKIKLNKKGKFTAKIAYGGDSNYNTAKASVKITIK